MRAPAGCLLHSFADPSSKTLLQKKLLPFFITGKMAPTPPDFLPCRTWSTVIFLTAVTISFLLGSLFFDSTKFFSSSGCVALSTGSEGESILSHRSLPQAGSSANVALPSTSALVAIPPHIAITPPTPAVSSDTHIPGVYAQPPLSKRRVWFDPVAMAAPVTPLKTGTLALREERSPRWIVVTSINPPTDTIKRLAALPGWRTVVIGDTKTPKDWAWPNVTFLSVADQLELGFSLTPLIHTRAYTRKNIGYLYAALHGATTIYETDDDNELTRPTVVFIEGDKVEMLEYVGSGSATINHHGHFAQPATWPRGYPLEKIATPQETAVRSTLVNPAVQQGLADGDPDMDAVFRLTRKPLAKRVDFEFAQSPPIALPRGTFAPFNAQNTIFNAAGIWAMPLPQSVEFRVCDIWRAYWAQRLLWGIGARLTFVAPYVYQLRNAHDYWGDYMSELQIFDQVGDLLKFLGAWTCATDGPRALRACALQLSHDMAQGGFWGPSDVELIRHFHHDLERTGYVFPEWTEKGGDKALPPGGTTEVAAGSRDEAVEVRRAIELYGTCGEAIPVEGLVQKKEL